VSGNISIRAKNLGKLYTIGQREQNRTLREAIVGAATAPIYRIKDSLSSIKKSDDQGCIWALKDVSFEVEQGAVVGIIGRNGSGKSTLLKILSRITKPTEGTAEIYGRVGSLLEVGTGFHPELTGRENIYLGGSLLGMRKIEINDKFDEIVKFSEIEKFLDTPVKRYSSGMYVRLAFSVAAHLDPEILLVDEVLAVGDAAFQKKCLGKMKTVSGEGRTVLFVSHNMNAVEQLCDFCMLLEDGTLKNFSITRDVIKDYLFGLENKIKPSWWINNYKDFDNPWFKPLQFYLGNRDGKEMTMPVDNKADMWVYIKGEIKEIDPALTIGYAIYTEEGTLLYWSYQTDVQEDRWIRLVKGINILRCKIPKRFLNEGAYRIEFIGGLNFRQWLFEPGVNAPAIFLTIQGGLSDSPLWMIRRPGLLAPVMEWDLVYEKN